MSKTKLMGALLVLCLLAFVGQARPQRRHRVKHPPKQTSTRVAAGVWGGPHVRLQVSDDGGAIEYDCGHGTLAQPLVLDAQGRFSVAGTHTREGGPVRIDIAPASQPVSYTGSVHGQTMTLTVTFKESQQSIGTFTLTQGSGGRLWKCL